MPSGKCENCGCEVGPKRWVCDQCFRYFDGERFLDPEDCEITIITELGDEDDEL